MKFIAPPHVSSASVSSGPIAVVDGILELPDDAPQSDVDGLVVNGFAIIPDAPAAPPTLSLKGAGVASGSKDS